MPTTIKCFHRELFNFKMCPFLNGDFHLKKVSMIHVVTCPLLVKMCAFSMSTLRVPPHKCTVYCNKCSLFFSVPAITIAGSTVITSIVGTAGLVALPTMAAGTLAPGTLAPGVMSTSIAAQPIMTASTALLAGKVSPVIVENIKAFTVMLTRVLCLFYVLGCLQRRNQIFLFFICRTTNSSSGTSCCHSSGHDDRSSSPTGSCPAVTASAATTSTAAVTATTACTATTATTTATAAATVSPGYRSAAS